jgi:phosphoribosyl-ATP pyrophosphohydrolase/phosphoribosyl-AMP cyclohydrolase
MEFQEWLGGLKFDGRGLVPVIAQDAADGRVLTLAWASAEALRLTHETGQAHYYSRSREALWRKGETSGHTQQVASMTRDCDQDAVLYEVVPAGPACHTGQPTCFHEVPIRLAEGPVAGLSLLQRLYELIEERRKSPAEGSYTSQLFARGLPRIAQKVGEEAVEVGVAALSQPRESVIDESADLLYHLLVLWSATGVSPADVMARLAARRK